MEPPTPPPSQAPGAPVSSGAPDTTTGRSPRSLARSIATRLIFLTISVVTLYILWPSLIAVFRSWPELLTLNPLWYPVMLGMEAASFICAWGLQRLALATDRWFVIGTAQLAGNAVSKVVPGGAAAGGATQFKMLTDGGIPAARVGTGLAVASLLSTGSLFALPLLSVPAALLGRPTPSTLAAAAWLGGVVFVVGFAAGWVVFTREPALRAAGRGIQAARNSILRKRAPLTALPDTLVTERDVVAETLERSWWRALLLSLGNWLFDYLALLAALAAVGSTPRPSLVLLAYCASMVLAMIPITPGGLGFVEAGLAGLLVAAGVNGGQATLAVLAYRLVSYWLPLPIGGAAAYLHRRRYRGRLIDPVIPDPGAGGGGP
jgi:uncharacterized protein (TIRG00374 family)